MIIGIGVDIVEIERIDKTWARFGERFLDHILCQNEKKKRPAQMVAYLASRFAAKEAAAKALGTGFVNGITPPSIEIGNDEHTGKPILKLNGAARKRGEDLGVRRAHISISHERKHAIAMVILED